MSGLFERLAARAAGEAAAGRVVATPRHRSRFEGATTSPGDAPHGGAGVDGGGLDGAPSAPGASSTATTMRDARGGGDRSSASGDPGGSTVARGRDGTWGDAGPEQTGDRLPREVDGRASAGGDDRPRPPASDEDRLAQRTTTRTHAGAEGAAATTGGAATATGGDARGVAGPADEDGPSSTRGDGTAGERRDRVKSTPATPAAATPAAPTPSRRAATSTTTTSSAADGPPQVTIHIGRVDVRVPPPRATNPVPAPSRDEGRGADGLRAYLAGDGGWP